MATVYLTIRGDQLGTFANMHGNGNGAGRVVSLRGTQPVGSSDEIYTVVVEQVSAGATQFANGQFVTIYDQDGGVVMPRTGVQPDIEQGLGGGDEHLIFQSSKFFIDLNGVTRGKTTYTNASQTGDPGVGDNDGEMDFSDTRPNFPCYATGTLIRTDRGPRPVEDLVAGDRVTDLEGRAHVLLWTAARRIVLDHRDHPQRPILFRPGSLPGSRIGPRPHRDLLVSPQHRMLVVTPGGTEMLAPAHTLTARPGVRRAYGLKSVTYHALLLPRHAVLCANGAAAESFYPGPFILRQLPAFQRLQVLAHVPALLGDPSGGYGPAARPVLTPAAARDLHRAVPLPA